MIMTEEAYPNFNFFIKENSHWFVIGNIFLFFSLYLLGFLLDSNLTEKGQIILVQIMIVLTGFIFLTSVSMLFAESIKLRKDEMVFWKIWKLNIFSEDIWRLIFFIPLFLVASLYWAFIASFFLFYPLVFSVIYVVVFILLMISIKIQKGREDKKFSELIELSKRFDELRFNRNKLVVKLNENDSATYFDLMLYEYETLRIIKIYHEMRKRIQSLHLDEESFFEKLDEDINKLESDYLSFEKEMSKILEQQQKEQNKKEQS